MSAARELERRGAGLSQWQYDADRGRPLRTNNVISPVVTQWERDNSPAWRKQRRAVLGNARRSFMAIAVGGFLFTLGFAVASGPDSVAANVRLTQQLKEARAALTARPHCADVTPSRTVWRNSSTSAGHSPQRRREQMRTLR